MTGHIVYILHFNEIYFFFRHFHFDVLTLTLLVIPNFENANFTF